jgi:hypothetical protein
MSELVDADHKPVCETYHAGLTNCEDGLALVAALVHKGFDDMFPQRREPQENLLDDENSPCLAHKACCDALYDVVILMGAAKYVRGYTGIEAGWRNDVYIAVLKLRSLFARWKYQHHQLVVGGSTTTVGEGKKCAEPVA